MNFDDMAFAHMLKDYSVFSLVPRLSYAIRNWFVSMLSFKVARYPVFSRSTNLESKLIDFLLAHSPFLESQTVPAP